jgi:lactate dehydrogenase-like 2-hydroxyacid dehydrogenase
MPNIVIPDDYPVVMGASPAFLEWRDSTPSLYFDTLPGSEEGLLARIRHAEIVINIRSSTKFPASVFAACPSLKLLSLWGTGTDNVDLAAAKQYGVTVTNTPGVSAASIAEHSLMLALAVARRVVEIHNGVVAAGPGASPWSFKARRWGSSALARSAGDSRASGRASACG